MSAFVGYNGQAFSPAGEKGRFVLPSAFRKAVKESSGGNRTLCLVAHGRYACLVGFGTSYIAELDDQLEREQERAFRLHDKTFDRDARAGQLFTYETLPFDESGRFVMPEHLRELGKVEDGLFFQAAGKFFLVWAPDELMCMGPEFRSAQIACRKLMEAAAKKGGAA